MTMGTKTYEFKTNINCGGCVAQVTPHLDALKGIEAWHVATDEPDKTLTVKTGDLKPQTIQKAVEAAGFWAKSKRTSHPLKRLFG
jgi:copper chaperone